MEERISPGHWFALGLYRGETPLDLVPAPEVGNPFLTYRDVTDVPAIFVADPFMIREGGLWYLFFEVLNEVTYKGEIAVAVSADARSWQYRGLVLVEDWNVSYPHVFRWQDEIYMMPELYQQDCVRLYQAHSFPYDWRPVADLIADGPVADPSPFRFDGSWWLYLCSRPASHDVLRLYRADDLMGPWKEHPKSPIIDDDERSARPAGRVLVDTSSAQHRILRFAQDCFPSYGSSVRAFEITRLTAEDYAERPVDRPPIQEPEDGDWNCVRRHHVDAHQLEDGSWLAVIDGHGHPTPSETSD